MTTTLLRQLAQEHHALLRYDDGTTWRVNRQGIVMGRKAVNADVVRRLVERGDVEWVACQMWSRNEIWRPVEVEEL